MVVHTISLTGIVPCFTQNPFPHQSTSPQPCIRCSPESTNVWVIPPVAETGIKNWPCNSNADPGAHQGSWRQLQPWSRASLPASSLQPAEGEPPLQMSHHCCQCPCKGQQIFSLLMACLDLSKFANARNRARSLQWCAGCLKPPWRILPRSKGFSNRLSAPAAVAGRAPPRRRPCGFQPAAALASRIGPLRGLHLADGACDILPRTYCIKI